MVCQFLLYNKVNQLYIYVYPHISSLLCLPPTLPISPLQVVTKHRADPPVLHGFFPLAIYFTFGSVYKSMPLCYHVLPSGGTQSLVVLCFMTLANIDDYCLDYFIIGLQSGNILPLLFILPFFFLKLEYGCKESAIRFGYSKVLFKQKGCMLDYFSQCTNV